MPKAIVHMICRVCGWLWDSPSQGKRTVCPDCEAQGPHIKDDLR